MVFKAEDKLGALFANLLVIECSFRKVFVMYQGRKGDRDLQVCQSTASCFNNHSLYNEQEETKKF